MRGIFLESAGCSADAAVSYDDGGDTLRKLRQHLRRVYEVQVVMGMRVDEAGCQNQATAVEHFRGRPVIHLAYESDLPRSDTDISCSSFGTSAVEDNCVSNQDLKIRQVCSL